eukprot:6180089-Pleurochrysis_carterae.AAC.4
MEREWSESGARMEREWCGAGREYILGLNSRRSIVVVADLQAVECAACSALASNSALHLYAKVTEFRKLQHGSAGQQQACSLRKRHAELVRSFVSSPVRVHSVSLAEATAFLVALLGSC